MKKIIKEKEFKKANNIEKCKLILQIIKGQAIYTRGGIKSG